MHATIMSYFQSLTLAPLCCDLVTGKVFATPFHRASAPSEVYFHLHGVGWSIPFWSLRRACRETEKSDRGVVERFAPGRQVFRTMLRYCKSKMHRVRPA